MNISGTVIQILPAETVGQNSKTKQTFIIETEGQYPKKVAIEVWEDKVAMAMGEKVTLATNPESREYNNKWYTSIVAWRKEGAARPVAAGVPPSAPAQAPSGPPPAPSSAPAPVAAPPTTGGKLAMNAATFEKAKAAINALPTEAERQAKLDEILSSYEVAFAEGTVLQDLVSDIPF